METIALTGPFGEDIKVLISQLMPKGFKLEEISSEDDFVNLGNANYIILRTLKLNSQVISSIPNLKLIQRWGVGYDNVDIKAAGERNIPVAIAAGINSGPVAELTVLLMLAVYRHLIRLHNNTANGQWTREEFIGKSYCLQDKTVGLIGLGRIGRLVSERVKSFGARVQYYDVFRAFDAEEKLDIVYAELDDLLRTSDIISLHLPLNDSTRHLICKDTIKLMKPSAIIVNTARGGIIKESDLVEALENNRIMGAGLDTFENEPLDKADPLLKLKNIVVTPHIGGNTADNNINMARHCVENIIKVSKGEKLPLQDVVNSKYLRKLY